MIWEQPESKEELLRRARSYKKPITDPIELVLTIVGVLAFIALIVRLAFVLITMT